MRDLFDQELAKRGVSVDQTASATIEEFMYMSLWYAQLYTVIEGFNDLKLHDSEIDVLLAQNDGKYVQLLRRYRNGVAHFQADYFDRRFEDFFDDDFAAVAEDLHGRYRACAYPRHCRSESAHRSVDSPASSIYFW